MDIKKFTLKEKVYSVKPLNLFQLTKIRQNTIEALKTSYKKDVLDMASSVPEKDRSKFIFDAVRSKPFTDEDINSEMQSHRGIISILSSALNESAEIVESLITTESETILEVFNFAMQIEDKAVEGENSEKKVATHPTLKP